MSVELQRHLAQLRRFEWVLPLTLGWMLALTFGPIVVVPLLAASVWCRRTLARRQGNT